MAGFNSRARKGRDGTFSISRLLTKVWARELKQAKDEKGDVVAQGRAPCGRVN